MGGVPKVWLAEVSTSSAFTKPIFRIGDHEADLEGWAYDEVATHLEERATVRSKYRSAIPLSHEELGTSFSLMPNRKKPSGPHSIMNFGADRLIVTGETKTLLEELDPGPVQFFPIEVLNMPRTKPLWEGADLHVMQVLECRHDTVTEESQALSKIGNPDIGTDSFFVGPTDGEDPMVVLPPPEGAAEMWIDDRLNGALFLTDRIAKALRAAKFSRAWGLRECRVKLLH